VPINPDSLHSLVLMTLEKMFLLGERVLGSYHSLTCAYFEGTFQIGFLVVTNGIGYTYLLRNRLRALL